MSQDHAGGCHCGAVRFTVTVDLDQTATCNCSICRKTGWVMTFAPATAFVLEQGEAALVDYQFNKERIHHLFCGTCGIRSFARGQSQDGSEMISINVGCLDDIELASLNPTAYDGASL